MYIVNKLLATEQYSVRQMYEIEQIGFINDKYITLCI